MATSLEIHQPDNNVLNLDIHVPAPTYLSSTLLTVAIRIAAMRAVAMCTAAILSRCALVCLVACSTFGAAEIAVVLRAPTGHTAYAHQAVLGALDNVFAGIVAVVVFLYGARRTNRFEREIFLQHTLLRQDVAVQGQLLEGRHTQLLALFSNPSGPTKQHGDAGPVVLPVLKFGQEMKFLLRAIPPVYLQLLPAATLQDVSSARALHVHILCICRAPHVHRMCTACAPHRWATRCASTGREWCSSVATPSWAP